MRPADNINDLIKKLKLKASTDLDRRVHDNISMALAESDKTKSAVTQPKIGRTIMKSPIVKLAAAAVIVIAVVVGINLLEGSGTSLAWGEVAEKVQASQGLIYRQRILNSDTTEEVGYIMFYVSSTRSRMDTYKAGKITRTLYCDYDARNILCVDHNDKICADIPMEEMDVQDHEREMNLKDWIRKVLSRDHKMLGRKTIEGLVCEGIETIYPIFGDYDPREGNCITRVWVSVETGYPVLCEGGQIGEEDGKLRFEPVLDQFQWDVELDDSEFEPQVPPDYHQM